jgi:hypothetical protein
MQAKILSEPQNIIKNQLIWETKYCHLKLCGVYFNFLLFPLLVGSSNNGWISGRRAGGKMWSRFWSIFHLPLKFLIYPKQREETEVLLYNRATRR